MHFSQKVVVYISKSPWGDNYEDLVMTKLDTSGVSALMSPDTVRLLNQEVLNCYLWNKILAHYTQNTDIWPLGPTIIDSEPGGSEESKIVAAQLAAFCRYCDKKDKVGRPFANTDFRRRAYIAINVCLNKRETCESIWFDKFEEGVIRCSNYYMPNLLED